MPGPDVSDKDIDILYYIRVRSEPFATARDLEPKTSVGYKQTRNRLDDLVEKGHLNVETVGRVNVYWLTDQGKDEVAKSVYD